MSGIVRKFLTLAALFGLGGVVLGLHVAMMQGGIDSPVPVHAIVAGGVISTVFALFYHVVPTAAGSRMARIHFLLHAVAAGGLLLGLFLMLSGGALGPIARDAWLALYATMVLVAGIALGAFYRSV